MIPPEQMPPAPTMAPGKIDQVTAAYGPARDPSQSCGNCVHFDGAASCEIVDGPIDPGGVSDFWEPAAGGVPMGPGPMPGPGG
jgi:hypothetical protein